MKTANNFLRFIRLTVVMIAVIALHTLHSSAQEPLIWMPQTAVPGYDPLALTPHLIADQNQAVHAFNTIAVDDMRAIAYSQWTLETGWSEPNDVLLPPLGNQARLGDVVLDSNNRVHLVFFSGDDIKANIYYTSAPLALAGNAPAWSIPIRIGEEAAVPDEVAMVIDSNDHLHVLFFGRATGNGLYFSQSTDNGLTWLEPKPVFLTFSDDLFPNRVSMYIDSQDTIHALWNVNNILGQVENFNYANLPKGNQFWNEPQTFETWSLNQPSMIEFEDELILISHANPGDGLTRYMRRSLDGGQTWTEPVRLFPHVGSNGEAAFVIDSSNVLHMFFGNRIPINDQLIHGMWHSTWQNGRWTTPLAIVSGPPIRDVEDGDGFDPSFAEAVVSQGNTVLVAWRTDPMAGRNGAWYSYTTLDTPELPAIPLPTPMVVATPVQTPTPSISPTPTPTPTTRPIFEDEQSEVLTISESPASPIALAILPVIFLIAVVFVVKFLWN